jgi:outer membrane protein
MANRLRPASVMITALALAGTALVGIGSAHAETLNEALSAAYSFNPRIDAERANLRATDETVPQALSGFRPRIDAQGEVSYQHTNTDPDTPGEGTLHPKAYNITASQNLFNGFRTTYGVKGAEANVRAGRERLRFTEQEVLLSAVQAYMDTIRDQAIVGLREENVSVLGRELKATQERFAVGEVTRTDVAQAQARRAAAVAALDLARANLKSSRATFERVVGHPPDGLVEPSGYEAILPNSLDEAVEIAQRENPNIAFALYSEEQARHGVDQVRGELLPEVNIEASYTDRFEPSRFLKEQETGLLVGRVNVPIYEGGEVYSRVREAKHRHVSSLQQIEQSRTEVREQVTSAWSQLIASRAQTESDKVQVESTQTALAGVREEERVGQRTLLDVLDAQLELVNAQVQEVSNERNLVVNSYTLLHRTGRLEMTHLGSAPQVYDAAAHYEDVRRKWWGLSITHADGRQEFLDLFRCCEAGETGSVK